MVHIASSVAALLSQGRTEKHHLNWKWLEVLKNDRDRRDLVTCKTAAGIAAAFRAAVGSVLFAFEEMASWWRGALLQRAFFSTVVVAIMLRSFMDICYSGKCGLFGTGGLVMFNVTSENVVFHLNDVPAVLLLGAVGGILGALFNSILKRVLRIYNLINNAVAGAEGTDRVFVGGIPYYISEKQMKELLESFGPLKRFDLVKDSDTGNSKGYGFCVYQDPVTDVACNALKGLKMGDKTLTLRRAAVSNGQAKLERENLLAQ